MSSTRAASAASSRRAKQRLVQFLFGSNYSGKGRDAHKRLDHTSYSFEELRAAFLKRVHEIHPDKARSTDTTGRTHHEFVELQSAWAEYEKLAKMMTKVGSADANFTLFGVGCSFSDSPEEQRKRAAIMEEASRGWFTAGIISETATASAEDDDDGNSGDSMRESSIVDEDLFVPMLDVSEPIDKDDDGSAKPERKTLVDIPKHLRKRSEA
mmetsp:Transcript_13790/g.39617  ORF Transcript_13790/g.39617 Transcript_13790/m.39617 type:complete len:211 (-) Transcript_13790:20-652(-)